VSDQYIYFPLHLAESGTQKTKSEYTHCLYQNLVHFSFSYRLKSSRIVAMFFHSNSMSPCATNCNYHFSYLAQFYFPKCYMFTLIYISSFLAGYSCLKLMFSTNVHLLRKGISVLAYTPCQENNTQGASKTNLVLCFL
jgi:hypothetical protein